MSEGQRALFQESPISERKRALFIVISDLELYKELARWLKERYLNKNFLFAGSTFENVPANILPFMKKDFFPPASRLLFWWAFMNERVEHVYKPSIESGRYDIVFAHEFGREAFHRSITPYQPYRSMKETYALHDELVRLRLAEQGVSPPDTYIAVRPTDPYIIEADELYFKNPAKQRMHYLLSGNRDQLLRKAVEFISN